MKNRNFTPKAVVAFAVVSIMLAATAPAANITNTVPFEATFETHSNGSSIVDSNGWYAATNTYATVTNNGDYGYTATAYPLDSSNHLNVVKLDTESGALSNRVADTTTTDIWIDMMLNPTRWTGDDLPDCSDNDIDIALFVDSNGHPVVYHSDGPFGSETNVYSTISYVTIASGEWARVTLHSTNFSGFSAFEIKFDGNPPVTNALAYMEAGPAYGGQWFLEAVESPGVYKARGIKSIDFSGTGFLDDFVVSDIASVFSTKWWITTTINALGGSVLPSDHFQVDDGSDTNVIVVLSNFWDMASVTTNGDTYVGAQTNIVLTGITEPYDVVVTLQPKPDVATNGTGVSVPKWWLDAYNEGNTDDADTILDSDSDGISNWKEWLASTDPTNAASKFEIIEHYVADGTGYVVWVSKVIDPSLPPFRVLSRTDLTSGNWTVVDDNVLRGTGPGGTNIWEYTPPPGGAFYRVEATNAP